MSTSFQIDQMTLADKLRAMEALWEDLCRNEELVPVPQWHNDVLDERERLVKNGKARFVDCFAGSGDPAYNGLL